MDPPTSAVPGGRGAKLRPPRLRAGELHQDHLVAACALRPSPSWPCTPAGAARPPPCGSGSEADPRLSAWLSLDGADNDPVRFLRHVVRAVDGIVPVPGLSPCSSWNHHRRRTCSRRSPPPWSGSPRSSCSTTCRWSRTAPSPISSSGWAHPLPVARRWPSWAGPSPSVRLAHHLAGDDAVVLRRDDLAFDDREHRAVVDAAPWSLPLDDGQVERCTSGRRAGPPASSSPCWPRGGARPAAVLADLPHRAGPRRLRPRGELRRLAPGPARFLVRRRCSTGSPALCDAVRRLESVGAGPPVAGGRTCSWSSRRRPGVAPVPPPLRRPAPADLRRPAPSSNRCSGDERRAGSTPTAIPDAAVTQAPPPGRPALAATIASSPRPRRCRRGHWGPSTGGGGLLPRTRPVAPAAPAAATVGLTSGSAGRRRAAVAGAGAGGARRRAAAGRHAVWPWPASLAMLFSGRRVKQTGGTPVSVREAGTGQPVVEHGVPVRGPRRRSATAEPTASPLRGRRSSPPGPPATTPSACRTWRHRFQAGDEAGFEATSPRGYAELRATTSSATTSRSTSTRDAYAAAVEVAGATTTRRPSGPTS